MPNLLAVNSTGRASRLLSAGLCWLGFAFAPLHAQESATDDDTNSEVSVPKLLGGSLDDDNRRGPEQDGWSVNQVADRIWDLPTLIDNPDARLVKKLRLTGRYHGQFGHSTGSDYSDWETRRSRLGLQIDLLEHLTARSVWRQEGEDSGFDSTNLDDNYLAWRRWEQFGLKLGQQKPLWSQEWSTSSNALLTFERSLLVNQLRPPQSLGAYASGELGEWAYGAGWFSGEKADGSLHADGKFGLFSIAHDLKKTLLFADDARFRLDYLYSREDDLLTAGAYEHALATNISGKVRGAQVSADFIYGTGGNMADDVYGIVITPAYDVVPDKLQAVVRYQYARSNEPALRLQSRYEAPDGTHGLGDRYHAIYGGFNYFLRGNQLKLMAGVEYATMRAPEGTGGDYDGWTFLTGIRVSF